MIKLYKNIKRRRKELGMTQTELAKLTGYSNKSMIARIEAGDVDLPQSKIMTFAEVLKIDPSDLMGWDDEDDTQYYIDDDVVEMALELQERPDLQGLFEASRKLTPEDVERFTVFINGISGGNYKE